MEQVEFWNEGRATDEDWEVLMSERQQEERSNTATIEELEVLRSMEAGVITDSAGQKDESRKFVHLYTEKQRLSLEEWSQRMQERLDENPSNVDYIERIALDFLVGYGITKLTVTPKTTYLRHEESKEDKPKVDFRKRRTRLSRGYTPQEVGEASSSNLDTLDFDLTRIRDMQAVGRGDYEGATPEEELEDDQTYITFGQAGIEDIGFDEEGRLLAVKPKHGHITPWRSEDTVSGFVEKAYREGY